MATESIRKAWPVMGFAALLVFVAVGATQLLRDSDARAVREQGNVTQSGHTVGWGVGVHFSRSEGAALVFDEILNAGRLQHNAEFEYGGYVLKITQIRQVEYVPPDALRPETRLVKVVAKIQ
jgi:hypothetical protein